MRGDFVPVYQGLCLGTPEYRGLGLSMSQHRVSGHVDRDGFECKPRKDAICLPIPFFFRVVPTMRPNQTAPQAEAECEMEGREMPKRVSQRAEERPS